MVVLTRRTLERAGLTRAEATAFRGPCRLLRRLPAIAPDAVPRYRSARTALPASRLNTAARGRTGNGRGWVGSREGEQVSACPENRGLGLHAPDRAEQDVTPLGVVQPTVEFRAKRPRTLDREHRVDDEPCLFQLVAQLVGMVEVRGREPLRATLEIRVAMLPVAQVPVDDRLEPRVHQERVGDAVERRREPRDRRGRDDASRPQDPQASPSAVSRASQAVR